MRNDVSSTVQDSPSSGKKFPYVTENQDHGDVKNDELIAYKAIRKYKLFKKK